MSRKVEFERLTKPHMLTAFRVAFRILRNQQDAEDAVQDGYLKAFRYFDRFDGTEIRPWLLAIVRNAALDALKRQRNSVKSVSFTEAYGPATDFDRAEDSIASDELSPEERNSANATCAVVLAAIGRLSPIHREVLTLRELDGMSYREISIIMALPLGTVMSRLSRARDELRVSLSPLWNELKS